MKKIELPEKKCGPSSRITSDHGSSSGLSGLIYVEQEKKEERDRQEDKVRSAQYAENTGGREAGDREINHRRGGPVCPPKAGRKKNDDYFSGRDTNGAFREKMIPHPLASDNG